jgi:low temperature requirement protein LtrA
MANKAGENHNRDLEAEESRVTSLELFFDLVFVFTLTQLTALLEKSLSWESLLHASLFDLHRTILDVWRICLADQ